MSTLPGNPFAESWKDESDGQWGMTQATLVLAFEQRTANLIALATMNPEWYGSASKAEFAAINARLGLGDNNA